MSRWSTRSLASLCSVISQRAAVGIHPYLEIGDIDPRTKNYAFSNKPAVSGALMANSGDVLISRVRPSRGAIAVLREKHSAVSAGFTILRPYHDVSSAFLFYSLAWNSEFLDYLSNRSKGALYPTVPESDVLAFEIPTPPVAEQERIVRILEETDAVRRLRGDADELTKRLPRDLFNYMFGYPPINRKAWPTEMLGNLLASSPQNGLYKHSSFYGSGTPILRIDAFSEGEVHDLDSLKRVQVSPEELSKYQLREDDIVINRVNSPQHLGKSALIRNLKEPTVFESNMMRISLDQERLNPVYLIWFLQMPPTRRYILSRAKDAINQSSINQRDVCDIAVPLPPITAQRKFAAHMAEICELQSAQALSRQSLADLFHSLLQRAFQGEL